jgi:alpha/beta hydrolase fold
VLFPEYRLAPEHPFPAAIDHVLSAWGWLRTDQDLGARSIAVAGDSAGGGLTVALLVATRDAGEALPAAAVLMFPTVDLTSSGASMTERADQDPISTPAMLRQVASDYLAGADPKTPLALPLFASLSGLPPLLVQVGTAELLLSDSERLARAAGRRGRRHRGDRRGPSPRLPDHARHPRGSRSHRADRKVPARPGSLTRQPRDSRLPSAWSVPSRATPAIYATLDRAEQITLATPPTVSYELSSSHQEASASPPRRHCRSRRDAATLGPAHGGQAQDPPLCSDAYLVTGVARPAPRG